MTDDPERGAVHEPRRPRLQQRRAFPRILGGERAFLADTLRAETTGGLLLLVAAVIALIWANSPWQDAYRQLRELELGPLSVESWAADGALALFFYLAGLELKRELVVGTPGEDRRGGRPRRRRGLRDGRSRPGLPRGQPRGARRPARRLGGADRDRHRVRAGRARDRRVLAARRAAGVPADAGRGRRLRRDPGDRGVLLRRAARRPAAGRARADRGLYVVLQRRRVRSPWLYVPIAFGCWWFMHESGIHATIAGVALGLATRVHAATPARHGRPPSGWSTGCGRCPRASPYRCSRCSRPASRSAATPCRRCSRDPVAIGIVAGLLAGQDHRRARRRLADRAVHPGAAERRPELARRGGGLGAGRDRVHRRAADRPAGVRRRSRSSSSAPRPPCWPGRCSRQSLLAGCWSAQRRTLDGRTRT